MSSDSGSRLTSASRSPAAASWHQGRRAAVGMVLVCALAAILRLVGLQYGLPSVYNPDEVAIMARALSFATGTLNPHNFLYPTFYFYLLFAWVGVYLAFVWLTGGVESIAALQRLYFTAPTGIYSAGRTLGVASATATVLAVYRLGLRVGGQETAIAAAVLLSVAPLHVRDSHYVKHDVPATFCVVLAYLAMARLWLPRAERPLRSSGDDACRPRTRDTLFAAAACGLAFSTHYYCVFLAIPLTLAIAWGWKAAGKGMVARQLAMGVGASALVFFALSPFILIEPVTAWRDIVANRQIVVDRALTAGPFAPVRRYADMLWRDSVGAPVVVLASVGVVWMLMAAPRRALFLLAFPVGFLAFITNTAPASRYLNPAVPFLAVFAGWTLSSVARRLGRPTVFWAALAVAGAPSLVQSVRVDLFFRSDDTRTLAQRFIESRIPAGSTVLIQPYSVVLTPTREGLVEALTRNLGAVADASRKFQLQLSLDPYPQPAYRLIYLGRGGLDAEKIYVDPSEVGGEARLDRLRSLGVTFVVIKRYNNPDPETVPLITALGQGGRRIAAFSPYRPGTTDAERARIEPFLHNTDARIDDVLERPGPPLEIWQLDGPVP